MRAECVAIGIDTANQAVAVEDVVGGACGDVVGALWGACGFVGAGAWDGARTVFFGRAGAEADGRDEQDAKIAKHIQFRHSQYSRVAYVKEA